MSCLVILESEGALHSQGSRTQRVGRASVVEHSWFHSEAEVVGDVEFREGCVHVGIDDGEGVDAYHHEGSHISPSAEFVFTLTEDFLVAFYVGGIDCGSQMQKLVVALRVRVIIHNVEVGLRVVVIHLVVPGDGVSAAYETTIYNR